MQYHLICFKSCVFFIILAIAFTIRPLSAASSSSLSSVNFPLNRLLLTNYWANEVPRVMYIWPGPRGLHVYIFSWTNRPITTKLDRKYVDWPILGPNKGQNKEYFYKSSKIFFSWTTGRSVLIFGMNYPLGEGIQVCSNEVPRVMYGPAPGA